MVNEPINGEIRMVYNTGMGRNIKKIWQECPACHKSRWVSYIKGEPVSAFCIHCFPRTYRNGMADKNSHWNYSPICPQTGRERAERWFSSKPCEKCGELKTDRHHKDGNTFNNDIPNIAFLCRKHHMETDKRSERLHKAWCRHGHLMTTENTRIYRGQHICLTCCNYISLIRSRNLRLYGIRRVNPFKTSLQWSKERK